ncbi:MAG: peptidoglycan DD-metalloendopeptidase family protein [Paracoccaceae bacterium]|nr:peptidoglycan DD-metalloendopeptidase family protein [Paracoccaceae bacterium]
MTGTAFSLRLAVTSAAALALAGCGSLGDLDFDLRGNAGVLDTSDAARGATNTAPVPDARGVVSYPEYQVAVARRGDTVETVAARVGLPAAEVASYNALPLNVALREGAVVALPRRVGEPGSGAILGSGNVDVATIAGSAIQRAEGAPGLPSGSQPVRHQVRPGETAFSIARTYGVPVAALAEWNGLGPDLELRDGQYLLIPTVAEEVQVAALEPASRPGEGTATPVPPSAAAPLPEVDATPAPAAPAPAPAPAADQTAASDTSRLRMPVQGRIIQEYEAGVNEGISLSAAAGAAIVAADDGTVAAITQDTDQVPILVIRHEGNLLTVYAGVDNIRVERGDRVSRGERVASVRDGNPPFLLFEVREGFESVDPLPYLN